MKAIKPVMLFRTIVFTVFTAISTTSYASILAVFPDVNMFSGTGLSNAGNRQLATNLLDGGTNVFVSFQTGGTDYAAALGSFYNGLAGVTATKSNADLTSGVLSSIDLLILDITYRVANPYSNAEAASIAGFLNAGGNVGLIAEDSNGAVLGTYNALLSAIGSSMQLSIPRCCGQYHLADTILSTPLTNGVSSFELAAADTIVTNSGTAAVKDQGHTVVAYETFTAAQQQNSVTVPEPGTLALAMAGILGAGVARRKKIST